MHNHKFKLMGCDKKYGPSEKWTVHSFETWSEAADAEDLMSGDNPQNEYWIVDTTIPNIEKDMQNG